MSTFNTQIANAPKRLRQLAHAIHTNQRGTALTEFVICIPVFIIIFAGVINLNKLQRKSMALKIEATEKVWTAALPVQKGLVMSRMMASTNAQKIVSHVNSHSTNPKADKIDKDSGSQLRNNGHFGESYAMVNPAKSYADIGVDLEKKGGPVYNDRKYSRDLLRDDNQFRVAGGGIIMMIANTILNVTGTRPAIGAGIRYGIAYGDASGSVSIGGQNYPMETGYSVLVAPQPTGEAWAIGVTRITAESYKPFSGILGIEEDDRL